MNPRRYLGIALIAAGIAIPTMAGAYGLSVEVWTNRGRDAVYRPGEALDLKVRTSSDAHLLVYEIDSEGYVHVLFPEPGRSGFVEGRQTLRLPGADSEVDWVVREPVGQGYIVAIASIDPFGDLPWYLRPRDSRAEEVGYHGRNESDDEDGVTTEGRVVGDPFVAMERVRRRVVASHDDEDAFATAYTGYYVHEQVRYPRYLCYDCHRPESWSWWDGFDPYYAQCSVFDVRVNWHWAWGPSYWFGRTPYFVYAYRSSCPPPYRVAYRRGDCYSSWDGRHRWNSLWGPKTRRYKSPPPAGYDPPDSRDTDRRGRASRRIPPGFIPSPGADDPPMTVVRAGRGADSPGPRTRSDLGLPRRPGRGAAVEPITRNQDREPRERPELRSPRDMRIAREPIRELPQPAGRKPTVGRSGSDEPRPNRGRSDEIPDDVGRKERDARDGRHGDASRGKEREVRVERSDRSRERGSKAPDHGQGRSDDRRRSR